ncbi:MAG: hydroxymethylglutaryl-CoA lyase [Rhodobacteraceae bacterium]|nr:hydroxymethylglutaryl-CoA lyase [Paracoccaceae bacterium]
MAKTEIDVICREVGLRDGIQSLKTFVPTAEKISWIRQEAAAGMPNMQVCSFVPPKLLPQFSDAAEVATAAMAIDDLWVSTLVPNLKGAEAALKIGVDEIDFMNSVSESHSLSNGRRSTDQAFAEFERVRDLRDAQPEGKRFKLAAGMATSFGCSIEGHVPQKNVLKAVERFVNAGVDEVMIADTVGYGNPRDVHQLFSQIIAEFGDTVLVGAHFHDTRGLGLANVYAALEAGCRRFDASLAGLGGCPFAPNATGNIVMEDLVFLLEGAGLDTGIDLAKLLPVREIISRNLPEEPLHGTYEKAGTPKGFPFAPAA